MKKLSFLIGLSLTCSNALAAAYVGIGLGITDYGLDAQSTFDDPTGFEIFVGNRFSENLAVEASYIDFGESSDGIPPEWHINSDTFTVGVLGIMPVNPGLDLFGKIGLHMWDLEVTEDGFGILAEGDGQDIFFGFGANIKVSEQFILSARFNSYDTDLEDITMFSVNAQINF